MVASEVEFGREVADGGVLIESVALTLCHFLGSFLCKFAVADVIVGVGVGLTIHLGRGQLRAGVVREGVVHHAAVASGVAPGGSPEGIVGVGALCHESVATVVRHLCEQVALRSDPIPDGYLEGYCSIAALLEDHGPGFSAIRRG